jgi:hypothetical protein
MPSEPGPGPRPPGPFWWLADRDAFLQRFVIREVVLRRRIWRRGPVAPPPPPGGTRPR